MRKALSSSDPAQMLDGGCSNTSNMNHIKNLPDEILLIVFSYLTKTQLFTTIPQVCQHWEELHKDPSLYRSLQFTKEEPNKAHAVKVIKMASWLRRLELTHRSDANELLEHVGVATPNLETLILRNCRGSPLHWTLSSTFMRDIVHHCAKLSHVCLKHSKCESKEFFLEIGLRLPMLRVVDFGYATDYVTSEAMLNIANNCSRFEELSGFHYSDIPLGAINTFFIHLKSSLKAIEMNYRYWTDAAMEIVGTLPNLERLHLNDTEHITDHGLLAISQVPSLRELHMSVAEHITSRGWIRFFNVCNMSTLRLLSLTHCSQLDDDVLLTISDIPHLEDLTVTHADLITKPCWVRFFKTHNMKHIKQLKLWIADSVDDHVALVIVQNLRELTLLNLLMCDRITVEGHLRARDQVPMHCHYQFPYNSF